MHLAQLSGLDPRRRLGPSPTLFLTIPRSRFSRNVTQQDEEQGGVRSHRLPCLTEGGGEDRGWGREPSLPCVSPSFGVPRDRPAHEARRT